MVPSGMSLAVGGSFYSCCVISCRGTPCFVKTGLEMRIYTYVNCAFSFGFASHPLINL